MPDHSDLAASEIPFADGLLRADAAAQGIDAGAVAGFLQAVESAGLELHSFMLYRGGAVVAESWRWPYAATRTRMMHSLTKSVIACAIGMLVDEGRLSLQSPMMDFFPEVEPASHDPQLWKITVEHLLAMRTGHGAEVSGALWRCLSSSWIEQFFRIPIVHEPGSVHVYSSASSYMLSAIVSRITGQTTHEYLRPRLFEPLGIVGESWDLGPDGINPGGNGIRFRTVDALKLGILHANGGQWNGRQLLSREWVDAATRPQGSENYGYHWVVRPGCFYALGVFVQMVMVYPEYDTVLAVTAGMDNSQQLLPILETWFPAALHGASPQPQRAAQALQQQLTAFSQRPLHRGIGALAEVEAAISHRVWQVEANTHDVRELRFEFSREHCCFCLVDGHGEHEIVAGREDWIESHTDMPGYDLHHGYSLAGTPVVAAMRWLDQATLEMSWIFAETAFRDSVRFHFGDDGVTMRRSVNVNSAAKTWPELRAHPR